VPGPDSKRGPSVKEGSKKAKKKGKGKTGRPRKSIVRENTWKTTNIESDSNSDKSGETKREKTYKGHVGRGIRWRGQRFTTGDSEK